MAEVHRDSNESSVDYMDALDAKIVQYMYGVVKLQAIIQSIKELKESLTNDASLPMLHFIVCLGGSVFCINENAYNSKLASLGQYIVYKPTNINFSSALGHIPYDPVDSTPEPLKEIPNHSKALTSLKLFELLCFNAFQGYQKRLAQAKIERMKTGAYQSSYFDRIENIIRNEILKDDMDTLLNSELIFDLSNVDLGSGEESLNELILVDMDIKMLVSVVKRMKSTLERLKLSMARIERLKTAPLKQQEQLMKKLPDSDLTLHKIFALVLRLNDLYSVVRKIGRVIFNANYNHLHDQNFLSYSINAKYFRMKLLVEIDDFFNNNKKNGLLIATITRFLRLSAKHQVNSKTSIDFVKFAHQAYNLIETMVLKLEELANNWISNEFKYRNENNLLLTTLMPVYEELIGKVEDMNEVGEVTNGVNNVQIKDQKINENEDINNEVKDELVAPSTTTRTPQRSRSSSTSSILSTSSLLGAGKQNKTGSASPRNQSPLGARGEQKKVFSHTNGLANSLQVPKAENSTVSQRRRSNSQPIPIRQSPDKSIAATSGAAAALHKNPNSMPTHLARKSPSAASRNSSAEVKSPTPKKGTKLSKDLVVVTEGETEDSLDSSLQSMNNVPKKRIQELREAAKAGNIILRTRDQLTTVVYDPNKSSPVIFRRSANDNTAQSDGTSRSPVSDYGSDSDVLKHKGDDFSSSSVSATVSLESSSPSEGGGKRVRFTGVPEYTEAEDAPTNPSTKFLKNFAVFKSPAAPNYSFRKRDQLLREESLNFRSQLHQQAQEYLAQPNQFAKSPVNKFSKLTGRRI